MTSTKSIARLPSGARPPFRVFINGVEQRAGADYEVKDGTLIFFRPLAKEGKIGFWRWTLMFFGIAGTYRANEVVDVQYSSGGRTRLASGLKVEPLERG